MGAKRIGITDATDSRLTERERQVVALFSSGITMRDVGKALTITEGTVKMHLKNVRMKTKAAR